ncbi:MAG: serine hydrolase, partial [Patescibacteria group bacterium]
MKGEKIKFLVGVIFILILGIFSASFLLKANQEEKIAPREEMLPSAEKNEPEYFYFNKNPNLKPKVSAEAYLVGDLDTGEVILQKNEREKLPIASVSKLVTALVATELSNEGDVAQISKSALATYGKNGNFSLGEKIRVKELLYPLLLESSNDAAEALAEFWGYDTFIKKMN